LKPSEARQSDAHKLATVELRYEQDIVFARQCARRLAALLEFDIRDQSRISTAVSEIARNAFIYGSQGRVEFYIETTPEPLLVIVVVDAGSGILDLDAAMAGASLSSSSAGTGGLAGAKRLMEIFAVETSDKGTSVRLGKRLPTRALPIDSSRLSQITSELARQGPQDPFKELRVQNLELLRTMEELRAHQAMLEEREAELTRLNCELAETNQGVLALYAELDEKAISLQKANEVKSRFISNMTHEFRTPLNSILSLTGMLLDERDGTLNEEQGCQVRYIRKATEDLYEMVNDLLDLAKVEAGKTAVRISPFAVKDVFAALRGMFRPLLPEDSATLLVFDEVPGSLQIASDEAKVAQILRNFISNALKFTEQGEVRVSVTATETTVRFVVSDTGIGIAAADQEWVFEEFTQIESAVQRRVKGTGLGLPLTRKLATLVGGAVSVESTPGVGSAFSLTLPQDPGASLGESATRCVTRAGAGMTSPSVPAGGGAKPGGRSVLVVDDNAATRYVITQLLRDLGLVPLEAADGVAGLRLAAAAGPAAIVLDLGMPGLSGFEVLKRLKNDPATVAIPVVIYTSRQLDDAERNQLAAAAVICRQTPPRDAPENCLIEAFHQLGLSPVASQPPHTPQDADV